MPDDDGDVEDAWELFNTPRAHHALFARWAEVFTKCDLPICKVLFVNYHLINNLAFAKSSISQLRLFIFSAQCVLVAAVSAGLQNHNCLHLRMSAL